MNDRGFKNLSYILRSRVKNSLKTLSIFVRKGVPEKNLVRGQDCCVGYALNQPV